MKTYNFFAELCKIMWWRLEQIKGGGSSRLVFEMYDEQIEDLAKKITNIFQGRLGQTVFISYFDRLKEEIIYDEMIIDSVEILSHNRNNMIFLRNKLSDREATRCIDVLAVKIPEGAEE
ncbi:MAG: hypothetical protein WAV31_06530 [Candidatus Moraniibacteriota bacterium]